MYIAGHPITVSCAYSGRLAVAYRLVGPKSLPSNPKGKFLNFWVAIYECESTGTEIIIVILFLGKIFKFLKNS